MYTVNEQWEQLEKQNGGLIETITSRLDNGLDINEVNRAQKMLYKVVINADIKDMVHQFCDKYECLKPPTGTHSGINRSRRSTPDSAMRPRVLFGFASCFRRG